jgi:hypothetical protein
MTLNQLRDLKRWHVSHRRDHPLEYQVFDVVLTLWLLGWVGAVPALLLQQAALLPLCLLGSLAPEVYRWLRVRLHRSARLRCDWLGALSA